MGDPVLEARKVTHYYQPQHPILEEVTLDLHLGDSVAVQGTSGVGKTTLLEILGTMRTPRSGTVRIRGESVYEQNSAGRARIRARNLGFVFQEAFLLPDLTLWENCRLAVTLSGKDWTVDRIEDRFTKLIDQLGLDPGRRHERPANLSTGERQRLAVARALMTSPAILIADEPTGNLDPQSGRRLIDILVPLAEREETAILVATHDRTLAQSLAIHYHLAEGRLQQGLNGDG